jgi:hypothetical protein
MPPLPVIPAGLTRHVERMANYLGNSNTKEVHNLDNEKSKCNIGDIKAAHRVRFGSLAEAHRQGYDNCSHCLGQSKR